MGRSVAAVCGGRGVGVVQLVAGIFDLTENWLWKNQPLFWLWGSFEIFWGKFLFFH
ncbi:MAG: hypothetical protein ABIH78_03670 [Candidatus Peregrinibacteria bacterium]